MKKLALTLLALAAAPSSFANCYRVVNPSSFNIEYRSEDASAPVRTEIAKIFFIEEDKDSDSIKFSARSKTLQFEANYFGPNLSDNLEPVDENGYPHKPENYGKSLRSYKGESSDGVSVNVRNIPGSRSIQFEMPYAGAPEGSHDCGDCAYKIIGGPKKIVMKPVACAALK